MAPNALTMIIMHVMANIPEEILDAAFQPLRKGLTLDECILQEIIYGRILLDVNLLVGKKKRLALLEQWKLRPKISDIAAIAGSSYDASFYRIPPEAREYRQISTVQNVVDDYSYALPTNGGVLGNMNNIGNTVQSLASAVLASRTMYNYPFMPQATLQSGNIIRVYPETYSDGIVLECTLVYDDEFTNANQNVVYHLKGLALIATKTYIYNKLLIKIDSAEVVGGMAIGAFKDKVLSYENAENEYHDQLMLVRGGSIMDPDQLATLYSYMI